MRVKKHHFMRSLVGTAGLLLVISSLSGCGKSSEVKTSEDTAAIRAMMEKAEAEKAAQQEKSKANFAKMRKNAEDSAKRQGHDVQASAPAQ